MLENEIVSIGMGEIGGVLAKGFLGVGYSAPARAQWARSHAARLRLDQPRLHELHQGLTGY